MPHHHNRYCFVFVAALMASAFITRCTHCYGDDLAELHAILKSNAALHDKGVACRRLAIIGVDESIPILADLLQEAELSHLARAALEAIPSQKVDIVFLEQLEKLRLDRSRELQLIGIIDSMGSRRNPNSVESLANLLPESSQAVQLAIVSALGKIASDKSSALLLGAMEKPTHHNMDSIADAALRCADVFAREGKSAEAMALINAVRSTTASSIIQAAATLSAIRNSGSDSLRLLNEQLQSTDDDRFAVGLQAARFLPKHEVAVLLTQALSGTNSKRSILLLAALTDLGETSALSVVKDAVQSEDAEVKIAAIRTLGKIGDASVLDLLLLSSESDNAAIAAAARSSLVELKGEEIDHAIVQAVKSNTGSQETLLRLIGDRRIPALLVLWEATKSSKRSIRTAAIESLGCVIPETEIDKLVDFLIERTGEERMYAVSALTSACRRTTNPDEMVLKITSRFANSPLDLQIVLYELLKSIGGDLARQQAIQGAMNTNEQIRDAATRVLGEWPTPDVGPDLLTLCQSLESSKYKIRALRAFIRVFRQFGLPNNQRLQMARDAFALSTRLEEKVLVLHALLSFQNRDSMQFAIEHLDDPGLEATSAQVAIYIADQVSDKEAVIAAMHAIINSGAEETYAKQARDILAKLGVLTP